MNFSHFLRPPYILRLILQFVCDCVSLLATLLFSLFHLAYFPAYASCYSIQCVQILIRLFLFLKNNPFLFAHKRISSVTLTYHLTFNCGCVLVFLFTYLQFPSLRLGSILSVFLSGLCYVL